MKNLKEPRLSGFTQSRRTPVETLRSEGWLSVPRTWEPPQQQVVQPLEETLVPVAERVLLALGQRRQLWRSDEHRVLAALGLVHLDEPRLLRPLGVRLLDTANSQTGS